MDLRNTSSWIPKQQYVSFDVFDTLIKRSVAKPTDLFVLLEQYCKNIGMPIDSGFAQKRQKAERRAAEKKQVPVCLDGIYSELREEFGTAVDALKELELQFELDGCRPNPSCTNLLRRCVDAGKTVVLISDMYLPSSFIEKMLAKCDIHGYKKLYVSCEMGARKRDGSLYRAVLAELRIGNGQLYHIGDNLKADYLRPLLMGIRAAHIENDQKALCKRPKEMPEEAMLSYRTMRACIRNCSYGMTEYEKMGCEIFGPQLYGFVQWLAEKLKHDGIEEVYFLARDGYMLKQAFEALHIDGIRSNYLYCSRRAYQVPLLWLDPELKKVMETIRINRRITLRRFLLQIGLDPQKYGQQSEECGLDLDRFYEKERFTETLGDFYARIQEDVVQNSQAEYDAVMAYFRTLHLPKRFALVDVGFRGTIQHCMELLLGRERGGIEVKGYYFSGSKADFQKYNINAEGYIYRKEPYNLLFEAQYLSQDGSLRKFQWSGTACKPIFEKSEYDKNGNELLDEGRVIRAYQAGALKFIKYMRTVLPINARVIESDAALYPLNRLVSHPTLREVSLWGDFRYINYTRGYMAHPKGLLPYMIHPKLLLQDVRSCGWQVGFLRRLFKIPLPYERILEAMRKFITKSTE